MKKVKCECGHINPEGTILCEACGKPVDENQYIDGNKEKKLLNMRYDGIARRSQTYTTSIIDKIWSFFSSVKVGIWLIVIALLASILGTIFPQAQFIPQNAISRDPAIYYEDQFGIFGLMYYQLGLYKLYSSWWYMVLLGLIGISLVICSLDRFVPLYKALKIQNARRHETFLNRQRLYSETYKVNQEEVEKVKASLKKQRYKVRDENGHILAEKGRFSRWGPYVNHIGLIIVLLAAILRFSSFLYKDEYIWIREGEQKVIPGTDGEYYIENLNFIMEMHDENDERFKEAIEQEGAIPSNYQTDVVIYKDKENKVPGTESELEPILESSIQMNKPAKFDGYTLYQSGYQLNEFSNMTFKIFEKEDSNETALDSFSIDLTNPESNYVLENGFQVDVEQFYPDYILNDDGAPTSETNNPKNPAFVFSVYPPDSDSAEVSFIGIGMNIDATGENDYVIGLQDYEMRDVSGLQVRRDYTLPLFGLGSAIFMIGVIQGMYWQHRRIWIHPKENKILIAAHTNKNWFGIKKDIEKSIKNTSIKMVVDQKELDK
ncbi:cytochrome c biogenesis protein ResB [Oceanobacillus oncorhynchi subsp. incaldanensis]|uniref:cytochrome c biogenesis protein ResB n=1 Tax=Oceanobacillus oncorhynchi TaxID=545501 RepID=UPI001B074AD3|nr:cytochrome c biogenesis protein ResB [Oceanobacillus oncorhynchi]GIO19350.1 cytochrome c biogenesis protein ResB [Oceanobacillus oncorhynchi subsp. incaldanensis]